ncbi:hypothetical protein DPMN_035326 [Dreissena polymorpha]|uniref:Uncharacterized protein n=1 Tax=Dreissena polymorpha TaxID=45954 RepID=A0A9D4MAR0_DREPO|nr:hypothetical protein DPMN_035326 [Dreissena polymorpha]
MQSLIGTQLNNRLFGQLVPDAQRHFLCIGGSWLLAQDLGANAQRILPAGCSQSKPGFQTFLPKGRDYLIHKVYLGSNLPCIMCRCVLLISRVD